MAILIVTVIGENYGSALQSYALKQCLEHFGCDSSIIKLESSIGLKSWIKRNFIPEEHYGLARKQWRLLSKMFFYSKLKKIKNFYHNNMTFYIYKNYEQLLNEPPNCRVFIAGSDQVWNPMYNKSSFTYLGFVNDEKAYKFSYAASIGVEKLSIQQMNFYREQLKGFSVISVRETSGKELLGKCLNCDARADVDPVLLIPLEKWRERESAITFSEPFIFVYMLRPNKSVMRSAQQLSKTNNIPICYIGDFYWPGKKIHNISNAGVEDFLSYIDHAKYVLTNSFHGTVFSILFRKQFMCKTIDTTGSRITDVLKNLDLENRLLLEENDICKIDEYIPYVSVHDKLNALREESLDYLKSIAVLDDLPKPGDNKNVFREF